MYEAEYRGERVAMKESLSQLFKIEEVSELSREISMLYKARHPNIVQFFGKRRCYVLFNGNGTCCAIDTLRLHSSHPGLCFVKERRSIAIVVEWCPETLKQWMESVKPAMAHRMDVVDKAQEIAVGMR